MGTSANKKATDQKVSFEGNFTQRFGAYIFLVALVIIDCIFIEDFASMVTFWAIWPQAFTTIMAALGMTLVIATGGIDISTGSILSLGATLLAHLYINLEMNLVVAVLACLIGAGLIGLFNGFIVARFKVPPIVVTLISQMVFRGIAQVLPEGKPIYINYKPLNTIATYKFWAQGLPIQFLLVIFFAIVFIFVAKKTLFGRQIQVVGENSTAAKFAGINNFATTIWVYVLAALSVGIAAIVEAGRVGNCNPTVMGLSAEMDAIAAVAVGGTSMTGGKARILGSIAGALIMQLIGMTVNYNGWPTSWGEVLKAVILIAAVCLQTAKKK